MMGVRQHNILFCNIAIFGVFLQEGCKRLDSYSSHLTRFSAPPASPLSGENPHHPILQKQQYFCPFVISFTLPGKVEKLHLVL